MKRLFKPPLVFFTIMSIVIALVVFGDSGYDIFFNDISIVKNANDKVVKITRQISCSKEMKKAMLFDISQLYSKILREYIKEKNLVFSEYEIRKNIKNYRAIIKIINSECEEKTINDYILNNHLFEYINKSEWDSFKKNAVKYYLNVGKDVLSDHYDDNFIMPVYEWIERAKIDLYKIISENANILLENLLRESNTFNK